jgi:hypothetical protein
MSAVPLDGVLSSGTAISGQTRRRAALYRLSFYDRPASCARIPVRSDTMLLGAQEVDRLFLTIPDDGATGRLGTGHDLTPKYHGPTDGNQP